jgi:hypothetical protein
MKLNSQPIQCWMMKLKKNQFKIMTHKKQPKSTLVNPLNTIFGSWSMNNLVKRKENKFKWWNSEKKWLIKKNKKNLNQPG